MKLRIACVQMRPILCERRKNLEAMAEFVKRALKDHPTRTHSVAELITSGTSAEGEFRTWRRSPGRVVVRNALGSRRSGKVHVIFGFPERDRALGDILYNSSALLRPDGSLAGVYRKVHLFDTEKRYFRPGCEYPLFQTEFGAVGIMICWDTAFPEVARIYALKGADLLAVSTNWEKPYADDWDLITRARAFDNCLHLAAANRIGFDKTLGFFGRSKIIDPVGKPIAALDEEREGIVSAEIDLTLPETQVRVHIPFSRQKHDTMEILLKMY
jgi:predicted amidohydrolase